MSAYFESLGRLVIEILTPVFRFFEIFIELFVMLPGFFLRINRRLELLIHEVYKIGVESLPVIALSLTFVGIMLILEFSFHMKLVLRQDELVPAFSTVLLLREIGPMVTCLLLSSRVGAGMAAEVGMMRLTEQIDALKTLSIHPVEYLVVPKWIATVFSAVALSVISVGVAIIGSASLASFSLSYTMGEFFNTMFTFAKFYDLIACCVKAFVFGSIIPIVACYQGFYCKRGSDGVGKAATRSVVVSSILIILLDFVLTYLLYAV